MRPARELVRQIARGGDLYNVMVVHDKDRWIWSVALTSAVLRDQAHWGRLLGCGEAADQKSAWQGARRLVDLGRRQGTTPRTPTRRRSGPLAVSSRPA